MKVYLAPINRIEELILHDPFQKRNTHLRDSLYSVI